MFDFIHRVKKQLIERIFDLLSDFSDDEIRMAALKIVGNNFHCSPSWIRSTLSACDDVDADIAKAREKYSVYEPKRILHAIMDWLDYFQHQANEARSDIVSQKSRRELEAYREEMSRESVRVRELMDVLNKRRP